MRTVFTLARPGFLVVIAVAKPSLRKNWPVISILRYKQGVAMAFICLQTKQALFMSRYEVNYFMISLRSAARGRLSR